MVYNTALNVQKRGNEAPKCQNISSPNIEFWNITGSRGNRKIVGAKKSHITAQNN